MAVAYTTLDVWSLYVAKVSSAATLRKVSAIATWFRKYNSPATSREEAAVLRATRLT
jgi:hypothetical protein